MKKHLSVLCLIFFVLQMTQFPSAQALQKTHTWYVRLVPGERSPSEFEITLIVSEGWEVDTTFDVSFILTLVYKSSTLTDTYTKSVKIILRSWENFVTDSGEQEETVILRNIGDHWEKKVPFNIPAEKVPRGQSVDVEIDFGVTIVTIATNQVAYAQWTNSCGDTLQTSLYRPFLSFLEWVCIIIAVGVVSGLNGFIIYRRRLASVKARKHPTQ